MSIPKALLYYYPDSVWSSTVLLALKEKGYSTDELSLRVVDLAKGEHYDPSYLRINPLATVPTLVVPLDKTLSEDIESRYRSIKDTKAIVEFLDKSRSPLSHTNTTSDAPAPILAPATIGFNHTSTAVIEALHVEGSDATQLKWLNALDDASLPALAQDVLPALTGRRDALTQLLESSAGDSTVASTKTKALWQSKKDVYETTINVLENASISKDQLTADQAAKREDFFAAARKRWQTSLKMTIKTLEEEIVGPLVLGEQISLADLHLAAYLARIALLVGATGANSGKDVVAKLESRVGSLSDDGKTTSKLAAFWDAFKERKSWKEVYGDRLH